MITPTASEITAIQSLVTETIELINAERDKPLQGGQTAYRGTCARHPNATFPLRATRKGAGEDASSHILSKGSHSVDIIEAEFTQKDEETLIRFTNTISELVSTWTQQTPGHTLDQGKLEALAYKEAHSWTADGFTQTNYRIGWDCWNEDKLNCRHTLAETDFESMTAESIVKIAAQSWRD